MEAEREKLSETEREKKNEEFFLVRAVNDRKVLNNVRSRRESKKETERERERERKKERVRERERVCGKKYIVDFKMV